MKWISKFLPVLLVAVLFGSCNRNPTSNPGTGGAVGTPTSIYITPITQIRNFQNATVQTNVKVTVNDAHGQGVSGARVAFSVSKLHTETNATVVATLTDTTDANGVVNATLTVILQVSDTVTVEAHLVANSAISARSPCPVVLLTDQIQSFLLDFINAKTTLVYRQGSRDSTQLVAHVLDDHGLGIAGLTVNFSVVHTDTTSAAPYVTLSASSGTTDNAGEIHLYVWNNPNSNLSRLVSDSISASIQGMVQSAAHRTAGTWVHVQPQSAPTDVYLRWVNPADTTSASQPGVVITKKFVIWVQDSAHVRLPSISILLRSIGIGSIPQYTATSGNALDTLEWSSDGMIGSVTITASLVQGGSFDKAGSSGPVKVTILGANEKLSGSMPKAMSFENNFSNLTHPQLLGMDQIDARSASISYLVTVPSSITRLTVRIRQIPPLLYATGRDSLEVNVTLRDQLNSGVPDALLTFSTRHGSIPASAVTDPSGTIRAYLRDLGGADTTGVGGDYIYVRYPAMNLLDSALYIIRPLLNLNRININGPTAHVAYPGDTVSFTATIFLSNGNYAYDSTKVYWNCFKTNEPQNAPQNGIGQFLNPLTRTANGATTNTFYMRTGTGVDSLVVFAFTEGQQDTVSHWWYFTHEPGPAVHLRLYPRTVGLVVNGAAAPVWAIVSDTAYNIVPNSPITWGCTNGAGTIVPNGYTSTGDTALALLSASSLSGQYHFWANTVNNASDTANFVVIASTPRTMTLTAESQLIQVRGTGGNENTTLHAVVRDGNGNPVANGSRVLFKITNSSQFNDTTGLPDRRPYFDVVGLDSTISSTSGTGEALAVLSSGYRSGAVQITAWVMQPGSDSLTNISATLSNVQIVAGPPAQITVSVNNDNGQQEGGGTWLIWVNATVRDRFSNPVANRYSVAFSVSPISLAQVGLDTAATGNTSPNNTHIPGVAFTRLSYQGQNSFDTVTVTASAVSRDQSGNLITISSATTFALPLQQGAIQLNVSPITIHFHPAGGPYPTAVNYAVHQVWVVVRDGYGQPIHACPVIFNVQRGRIFKTLAEASTQPPAYSPAIRADGSQVISGTSVYWPVNYRKTGNYTNVNPAFNWNNDPHGNGSATVYIGALGPCLTFNNGVGDIFLDPQTAETTSEVTAYIEGYPGVQSVRFVINYQRI